MNLKWITRGDSNKNEINDAVHQNNFTNASLYVAKIVIFYKFID